jgi:hypothetical protein
MLPTAVGAALTVNVLGVLVAVPAAGPEATVATQE